MKEFKAKKITKRKRRKIKVILFTFFFFFSYAFTFEYCSKYKQKENILNKEVNYINFSLTNQIIKKIDDNINKPINLLNDNIKVSNVKTKKSKLKQVISEIKTKDNNIKNNIYDPTIYIYNTHQSENYMDYGVYEASLNLSNQLQTNGIQTYFEEQSITTFLQENNLKYYKSYTVSRKYLNEAKEKYKNLTYYFDIHRDALSKEKSTVTINDVNYAKILFVVGADNKNYEANLNNANKLNEIIKDKYPQITRGVVTKQGKGVNGIYNQDLSENVFLIEVGGNKNTKDEVLRTIDVLKDAIIKYIRGNI